MWKSSVTRGAFWYSLTGLLASGTNVLLLPLLTRWMSPDEFGILSTGTALIALLIPLVTVGLGSAVVRYHFEYLNDRERFGRFFSTAFWFQIAAVGSLLIIACALFGSGAVVSVAGLSSVHIVPLLLVVALVPARDIGNQLLTARQKHGNASINQLVSFALATGITLLLVGSFDLGALGRLYGLVAGAFAAALMLYRSPGIISNLIRCWDWEELGVALRFGMPFVPHAAAIAALAAIDKLVLRHYLDFEEVGIYSAAMTVSMGMSFITIGLSKSWGPRFFQLREQGDDAAVLRGQWGVLCVMPLLVAGFGILHPVVYPLLVDPRYLEGMSLLPVLAMAAFGIGMFMTQIPYINYLKKTIWLPAISGSGALMIFVLSVFMVPKFGLKGAAWSTALAHLIMSGVLFLVMYRLELKVIERVVLPLCSMTLAITAMILAVAIPNQWQWWPRISICVGTVLLFTLIWISGDRLLMRGVATKPIWK